LPDAFTSNRFSFPKLIRIRESGKPLDLIQSEESILAFLGRMGKYRIITLLRNIAFLDGSNAGAVFILELNNSSAYWANKLPTVYINRLPKACVN
jgi:hypothetical protein